MSAPYDVVTVGGGLGGATLANSLARRGVSVIVVEQSLEFKDRVRGETMPPWGAAEARELGVYDLLRPLGQEYVWLDMFLGPAQMMHRDVTATTPQAVPGFNCHHPRMQEALLGAAAEAGAEVRRGAVVKEILPGPMPTVIVEQDGTLHEISARLVVGADGRSSCTRRSRPFEVRQDAPFLMIAGVLLDNCSAPADTGFVYLNPQLAYAAYLFPQGNGRVRAYCAWPVDAAFRLQGDKDLSRFNQISIQAGAPAALYDGVRPAGPLATFDAADFWVDHPYAAGVVLIGDAAASHDPSWGQGLSITLRDVRALRDCLLGASDWDAACHNYARAHDRHYGVIHASTMALKDMFLRPGPEFDALRGRALPLIAADPMRVPDHVFSGPDVPWGDDVLRLFFAQDATGQSA